MSKFEKLQFILAELFEFSFTGLIIYIFVTILAICFFGVTHHLYLEDF